ncbi:MAG: hypothetical protein IMZ62_11260 [Chloroflexi bacterium]|nr:hypothetical protein [Chloroflexota bacterium]
MSVGIDHDTAIFAARTILRWWQKMGRPIYSRLRGRSPQRTAITYEWSNRGGARSRRVSAVEGDRVEASSCCGRQRGDAEGDGEAHGGDDQQRQVHDAHPPHARVEHEPGEDIDEAKNDADEPGNAQSDGVDAGEVEQKDGQDDRDQHAAGYHRSVRHEGHGIELGRRRQAVHGEPKCEESKSEKRPLPKLRLGHGVVPLAGDGLPEPGHCRDCHVQDI